ncbi:MAG: CheA signal transduction histidine kinase [Acidobacteria bacterium]|nr:CheA signal transduction histidine kinase [Acidobacteriota bacterium]
MAGSSDKYFRVEAREILEQLGRSALDLEKGDSASDAVARILRLAHTLKGAARVVKRREIAELAHALEDALAPVRSTAAAIPRDLVDRVLALVDRIGDHVGQLTAPASAAAPSRPDQPERSLTTFRPATDDLDALLAGVFETEARLAALRPTLAGVERAGHLATLVADQLVRSRDGESERSSGQLDRDRTRSMAEQLRGTIGAIARDLTSGFDQLDREFSEVREGVERLRLTPAGSLFTFLERATRDAAAALGKRVIFDAHGGDVRVDAVVLNVVQGALLHIVRNAVAHGIEHPGDRQAAGKPVDGRVTLHVSQRGRLASFTCADDGRGIDLDAVRRIAQRRGLVLDDHVATEAEDLLGVLLKGGISTTQTVTDVSGRGIGLDVVRDAAERLGGTVTAHTEASAGTTIELVVPLSIVSFRALTVEVLGRRVAIPLDAVRGTLRLVPRDIVRTEQQASILFDGHAIPLASLQQVLDPSCPPARDQVYSVIVVQGNAGIAAFSVDRIVETAQIVMRPLPALARATAVVAGAALDAVGVPQLILDPDSLIAGARREDRAAIDAAVSRLPLLVVDDSLTTRMLEQSILESAGYRVELATSGEEGLEKVRAARYALILVDVEMPGMDGFTFIERIRADPELRDIPAILVTSRNAPDDLQRGRDVGAQGYMVKSEFAQGVLLEQIRALVG